MAKTTSFTNHQQVVEKANKEIENKKEAVKNSAYRLNYHFMAPVGWINDPNGLVQYKGDYQLFYQHYPYDSKWGPMHWGHARSKDLVHWEHLPVALAPSESYDYGDVPGHGCFSGSAVVDGDELVLIYTGHVDDKEPMQVQCIATSKDGISFQKYEHNPVIDNFPKDGTKDFRDPKVWKHKDKWYMVVGSKNDGKGKALLYVSEDLKNWDYKGVATESDGTQGDMWECPDLFPLGDQHVILVSPMYGTQNEKPFYVIGDMDYEKGTFDQKIVQTLDYGFDFYAPQTLLDEQGRRIMIGWMEKWLTKMPSQEHGWAGAMTIPRELVMEGNEIVKQKPVPELKTIRTNHNKFDRLEVEGSVVLHELTDQALELMLELQVNQSSASQFEILLRCSEDGSERTEIVVDIPINEIRINRDHAGVGEKGVSVAPFRVREDGTVQLQLFQDTTSIEVFVNGGEQVITNRIFPKDRSNLIKLVATDGKASVSLETWKLNSVWN